MYTLTTNRVNRLFKNIITSPLFYNFLIDTLPELDIQTNLHKRLKTVSFFKSYKLWKYIEKTSKRSDIGLLIADYFTLDKSGFLGRLFINSENLKDAIEIMNRFLGIIIGGISIKYEEVDDTSIFLFDIVPRRFIPFSAIECFIKICYNWTLIYLGDKKLNIKEIHFCYPEPEHFIFYKKNFPHTKIFFNEEYNYIVLEREIFYRKNYRFSKSIYNHILLYANDIKKEVENKSNFQQEITNKILQHLSKGNCNIKTISKELNLSESTVKRKLKNHHTTFKKSIENIRISLSESMIKDKNLTFEDIAYLLGYSEYSPFYRAFKKWFGISPSAYRESYHT